MIDPKLDEEAFNLYGKSFTRLSPFGQSLIQTRVNARVEAPTENVTMEHVDIAQALRVAHIRIEQLERENRDLWEDNEDLQLRLMNEEESNANRTSGSAE